MFISDRFVLLFCLREKKNRLDKISCFGLWVYVLDESFICCGVKYEYKYIYPYISNTYPRIRSRDYWFHSANFCLCSKWKTEHKWRMIKSTCWSKGINCKFIWGMKLEKKAKNVSFQNISLNGSNQNFGYITSS